MKTSLNLSAVAAKLSRSRRSGLFLLFILAAFLCVTRSASATPYGGACTYPLSPPYALGLNGAPIECNFREGWPYDLIPFVDFWFSTPPGDPVELDSWTTTWGYVSGDWANQIADLRGWHSPSYWGCQVGHEYPADTQDVCMVALEVERDWVEGGVGVNFITFTFDGNTIPLSSDPIPITLQETMDVEITGYSDAPEPGSLYLLGTGLLALAGTIRRKLRRR